MSTRDRVDPGPFSRLADSTVRSIVLPRVPERKPRTLWPCQPLASSGRRTVALSFYGAAVVRALITQPGNKSKKILWVNQKPHRQVRDAKRKTFQEGPSTGAANSRPTPATQPGESGLVDRDFQSDRVEDFHYARVSGGVSTHPPASVLPGYRPFATRLRCGRWHPSQSHAGPAGARREPSAGRRSRTGTRRQGNRAGRHRRACG